MPTSSRTIARAAASRSKATVTIQYSVLETRQATDYDEASCEARDDTARYLNSAYICMQLSLAVMNRGGMLNKGMSRYTTRINFAYKSFSAE